MEVVSGGIEEQTVSPSLYIVSYT
jgi:2-iminobutanoate/2-iminopropanoate deaminase